MPARNSLTAALPLAVEQTLRQLGDHLRTARLRRNLSMSDLAARLGVERHVIADAEKGKPTTGIAVYAGLLWVLGLLPQLEDVADPARDEEGLILARSRERKQARPGSGGLDNDF